MSRAGISLESQNHLRPQKSSTTILSHRGASRKHDEWAETGAIMSQICLEWVNKLRSSMESCLAVKKDQTIDRLNNINLNISMLCERDEMYEYTPCDSI